MGLASCQAYMVEYKLLLEEGRLTLYPSFTARPTICVSSSKMSYQLTTTPVISLIVSARLVG